MAVLTRTIRFRDPGGAISGRPQPRWWDDDEGALVYVTFGSVTGALPKPGTLAAGLPSAVVPLFPDQPYNARRVEELGAGLAVPADAKAIRDAIETVLGDPSHHGAAARLAAEMRALPPVDQALAAAAA